MSKPENQAVAKPTGRKKLERERSYIDAIPDGAVLCDRDGNIVLSNPVFLTLTRGEAAPVGLPLGKFLFETDDAVNAMRRVLEARETVIEKFTFIQSQGSTLDVIVHMAPVVYGSESKIGAIIIVRDVSAQRISEEQTAQLAAIVTSSGDAIISQSIEGYISVWNASAERIFGFSAAEAIGQPATLLTPAELVEDELEVIDRLWKGAHIDRYETLRKRKDGRIINVSVVLSAIHDIHGNVTGISRIERDITEQKKFEKELLEARRIAEKEKRAAEDLVRSRHHFLTGISHEIRTPLNAITGFTRLLKKAGDFTQEQREYIDAVHISGEAILSLVNDLLDLGELESGKLRFENIPFSPAAVVQEAVAPFKDTSARRGLSLTTAIDPGIPPFVGGDFVRLRQVISNLVASSLRLTFSGSVHISLRLAASRGNNVSLEFSVSDTGFGISAEELRYLMGDVYDTGTFHGKAYSGPGIGLILVKQIVAALGSNLNVRSRQGEGTAFWFTAEFPVVDAPNESAAESFQNEQDDIANPKILLVEDVVLNQVFMKTLLHSFGCEVDIAGNGKIAIEKIRSKNYDLVLMDLQMPVMNGYEATRVIRNEINSTVPVLALTADVTSEDVERCRDAGMNDYLPKPVDDKLLLAKIKKYCRGGGKPVSRTVSVKATGFINLDYLRKHTYNDTAAIKRILVTYVEETPRLIQLMKEAIDAMDWDALKNHAHSLLPSFQVVGLNSEYEEMARKIKEYAAGRENSLVISRLLEQLDDVCQKVITEVEAEITSLN